MRLVRLVYYSHTSTLNTFDRIQQLVTTASKNNTKLGVTGLLTCSAKSFVQTLEGPRDVVNRLFTKIARDPRHTDVTIMSLTEIERRQFSEWNMGLASLIRLEHPGILIRYGSTHTLNPEEMSAGSALALLQELGEMQRTHIDKRVLGSEPAPDAL